VVYAVGFTGRVAPVIEQALAFSLDGVVSDVHVKRGDDVETGDPIADLDTSGWEGQLVLANAALAIAQEQLDSRLREIELSRQRAELRRDLAQLDLDYAVAQAGASTSADSQYEINRLQLLLNLAQLDVDQLNVDVDPELSAEVDIAALHVAELENLISQATLTAPFDGIISGLSVSAGRAVLGGEPIGVISDAAEIEVSANVRDDILEQLAEEMSADIVPSGNPGDSLSGLISRLPYPYGSGGETALADGDPLLRIQFDDMDAALDAYQPGDRVAVDIVVTERDGVLWLPPAAIREFNGRNFVVVQDGDTQTRIDVTLGIEGDSRVEILEGLKEGQIIVGQ
jgi:RND family efflux transporter MFP subunit